MQSFFRPEEEHVHSGEGEIIVPFSKWDQKMNQRIRALNLHVAHADSNCFSTPGAGGLDLGIGVQRRCDAERVPGAVGEIGLAMCADLELCLHTREGIRHQDFVRARLQVQRVTPVKLFICRRRFFVRQPETRSRFLHSRWARRLGKMLVDKVTDLPDSIFQLTPFS